jgi:hypothetical protein
VASLGVRREFRKDLRGASSALAESREDRVRREREEFEGREGSWKHRPNPAPPTTDAAEQKPFPYLMAVAMLAIAVAVVVFLGTRK